MREVKKTKTAKLIVILCAVAIAFAGCTVFNDSSTETSGKRQNGTAYESKTAEGPVDQQPGTNEVQILIENFAFVPSEITIVRGTKITWINKDEAPHTATSTDKKFNTGGLDTDDKYSFVFNDKGEFPYFCALHPHMTASITVK